MLEKIAIPKNCYRCHESATCQVDSSFGDKLTVIQINCQFCGNKDILHSWCAVDDVELEVNHIYDNPRKLNVGDRILVKNKHYNMIVNVMKTTHKYAFIYLWGHEIRLLRDFYGPIHPESNTSYEFRLATN